jgi:hypothetical protein
VANNQAHPARARGEFVLLLNPDTVVEEDTFRQVPGRSWTRTPTPARWACGMIDGSGRLPAREQAGLPLALGGLLQNRRLLRSCFRKAGVFNGYYLGHLPR